MKGSALTFLPRLLLSLVGGAGLALVAAPYVQSLWYSALLASLAAFALGTLFSLPRSWRTLCFVLPLAAALLITYEIPATLLALAFAGSALLYLPTLWTRVPFYPTARPIYDELAKLLPADRSFSFVDLGCGFATLAASMAGRFPKGTFVGVEIGPLPLLVGKLRALAQKNLRVRGSNFWKLSLSEFDVVYAFLAPPPMADLWRKVEAEMKPGSIFVVNAFPVPDIEPDEIREISADHRQRLYLYRR